MVLFVQTAFSRFLSAALHFLCPAGIYFLFHTLDSCFYKFMFETDTQVQIKLNLKDVFPNFQVSLKTIVRRPYGKLFPSAANLAI